MPALTKCERLFYPVLVVFLLALSLQGVLSLPGGGTSLALLNDRNMAIIQNFTHLSGVTGFTVELWAMSRAAVQEVQLFGWATAANVELVTFDFYADFAAMTAYGNRIILPIPILPLETWHHYAFVVQSSGVEAFLDGVSLGFVAHRLPVFPATATFLLGRYVSSLGDDAGNALTVDPTLSFRGYLDEVRIWKVALNQSRVKSNLHSRVPEESPDLLVQWHFDDETDSADGRIA
eukprot:RCo005020